MHLSFINLRDSHYCKHFPYQLLRRDFMGLRPHRPSISFANYLSILHISPGPSFKPRDKESRCTSVWIPSAIQLSQTLQRVCFTMALLTQGLIASPVSLSRTWRKDPVHPHFTPPFCSAKVVFCDVGCSSPTTVDQQLF